jgi:RNA polymerase sigma-70 factor (ECF subfamily)
MDPELTNTWDLVRKAQDGDGDSMNRLFARYYERVRRSVRARIGGKLREELETADILQPAFLKAFQNFDRFEMRDEGSLLHWLAEYAHGQVHDAADHANAQKRRAPKPTLHLDDSHDGTGHVELPGADRSPSECASNAENQAAVEACLEELPEHYRRVIVLRDYDGLEWLEIARILQKNTDSAVRELYRRARLELAHRLGKRGIGPGADARPD